MSKNIRQDHESAEIPVAEWAKLCEISVQAANKRVRTLGIPRAANGGIDPVIADRIVAEKLDSRQQHAEPQGEGSTWDQLNVARLKHEIAKAEKAGIEAALMKGEVVKTEDVARKWGSLITPAKTKLLGIGSKVGPLVAIETDAATCQSLINGAVYETLAEIAEYRPDA